MGSEPREVRIPLTWNLTGRTILFVGGGQAALSKLRALDPFRPSVRLVAPQIDPGVRDLLSSWPEREVLEREFRLEDLEGQSLAYIFTDSPEVNRLASEEARKRGIPVNVAGDSRRDFTSPASANLDHFIISVASGGKNISGAAALRDRIVQWFQGAGKIPGPGEQL